MEPLLIVLTNKLNRELGKSFLFIYCNKRSILLYFMSNKLFFIFNKQRDLFTFIFILKYAYYCMYIH